MGQLRRAGCFVCLLFGFLRLSRADYVGDDWVGGSHLIGSNHFDKPREVAVAYEKCHPGTANRVITGVKGESRWPDTFNATVLGIEPWGFRALVHRTDRTEQTWGQYYVYLVWKAVFVDVPQLDENPCHRGAPCTNSVYGGRSCRCPRRRIGSFCETKLFHCLKNPCNGGNCTELEDDYECSCPTSRTGKDCTQGYEDGKTTAPHDLSVGRKVDMTILYRSCKVEAPAEVQLSVSSNNSFMNTEAKVLKMYSWGFVMQVWKTGPSRDVLNENNNVVIHWKAVFRSTNNDRNPCQNDGVCRNVVNGTVCDCPPYSSGRQCETRLSHCVSFPCMNGGTCVSIPSSFKCQCPIQYAGRRCEKRPELQQVTRLQRYYVDQEPFARVFDIAYDRCYSGIATSVSGFIPDQRSLSFNTTVLGIYAWGFRIRIQQLRAGWTHGLKIKYKATFETRKFKENPCLNSTACTNTPETGRKCVCNPGYTGEYCEQALVHCNSQLCNSGNCTELEHGYSCSCPEGTSGHHCEIVTTAAGSYNLPRYRSWYPVHVFDVMYPHCRSGVAKRVVTSALVEDAFPYTFNTSVVEILPWGFRVEVQRTDQNSSVVWPAGVTVLWTAFFDSPDMLRSPCGNGARCLNRVEGPVCTCTPQYGGEFCEMRLVYCLSNPCVHGTCVEIDGGFKCLCATGFEGHRCTRRYMDGQQEVEIAPNSPRNLNVTILYPACTNETASSIDVTSAQGGLKTSFDITTVMHKWGFVAVIVRSSDEQIARNVTIQWKAHFDREYIDYNPCWNRGNCTNIIGGRTCACTERYTGRLCEAYIPPCTTNPCKNGGNCTDTQHSYQCKCTDRYVGRRCDEDPTYHGYFGIPAHYLSSERTEMVINVNYRTCFTGEAHRIEPQVNDWGDGKSHKHNSTVLAIFPWGFRVKAFVPNPTNARWRRFDGSVTYQARFRNINYRNSPCHHEERCETFIDRGKVCSCNASFTGDFCETALLHCYPNPCNSGRCTEMEGGYRCSCPEGTSGKNCSNVYITGRAAVDNGAWISNQQNISVLYDSCKTELASSVELAVVGQVAAVVGVKLFRAHIWGFEVSLNRRTGFSVDWSRVPVSFEWKAHFESRASLGNPCKHNGKCRNTPLGPQCACLGTFFGDRCEKVTSYCENDPCRNGGTCVEEDDGYKCLCSPDFSGKDCEYALVEGFYHVRLSRYSLETRKTLVFDSCYGSKPVKVEGELVNLKTRKAKYYAKVPGVYRNGFALVAGRLKHTWKVKRLTFKYIVYFDSPNFIEGPCKNSEMCINMNAHEFYCLCTSQYKGKLCEEEILNCSRAAHRCQNGGSCVDTPQGYKCLCESGFGGEDCSLRRLTGIYKVGRHYGQDRKKQVDVVFGACHQGLAERVNVLSVKGNTSMPTKFSASKAHIKRWGFKTVVKREDDHFGWDQSEVYLHWEALFEAESWSPDYCKNNATCSNVVDGPVCHCPPGLVGKRCGITDRCQPNPCQNKGVCENRKSQGGGFVCKCPKGFVGLNCSVDISSAARN